MKENEYITIPQLAKILGITRIAVYKRVKKGYIKATKIGGVYMISKKQILDILGKDLRKEDKKEIDVAVRRTVEEYGEVLKLLGRE